MGLFRASMGVVSHDKTRTLVPVRRSGRVVRKAVTRSTILSEKHGLTGVADGRCGVPILSVLPVTCFMGKSGNRGGATGRR